MQYCRYNLQYGGLILSCHSHNLHGILKKDSTYSFERSSRKFTWNLSELITFYFTPKNIRKASVFWYLQSGIKANQFAWTHLNLKQNLEKITTIYPLNTSSISGKPSKRFSKLSKIEWKKTGAFLLLAEILCVGVTNNISSKVTSATKRYILKMFHLRHRLRIFYFVEKLWSVLKIFKFPYF